MFIRQICNKQQHQPNPSLPTIISIMLTPHKLQTNMVEMEEEAKMFNFRQTITREEQGQEKMVERVEKEEKVERGLDYLTNLILTDKLQLADIKEKPENLVLIWTKRMLLIEREVDVIAVSMML